MNEILLQYGILGVVVAGLAWYIMYLHKQNREREERWLKAMEEQFKKGNEIAKDYADVSREHTNILSGLKALIETIRK